MPFARNLIFFYRTNFLNLKYEIPEHERKDFDTDDSTYTDYEYFKMSYLSAAKITFNISDKEAEAAAYRYKYLKVLDVLVKLALFVYSVNFIYNYINNIWL